MLRAAGFKVMDVPERHFCCGSAGAYNMLQPAIAARLGQRKASHIESTGAAAVAAGNLGCMTQIAHHSDLPVVHTVELLDWATGGPMPAALDGVELPGTRTRGRRRAGRAIRRRRRLVAIGHATAETGNGTKRIA